MLNERPHFLRSRTDLADSSEFGPNGVRQAKLGQHRAWGMQIDGSERCRCIGDVRSNGVRRLGRRGCVTQ